MDILYSYIDQNFSIREELSDYLEIGNIVELMCHENNEIRDLASTSMCLIIDNYQSARQIFCNHPKIVQYLIELLRMDPNYEYSVGQIDMVFEAIIQLLESDEFFELTGTQYSVFYKLNQITTPEEIELIAVQFDDLLEANILRDLFIEIQTQIL